MLAGFRPSSLQRTARLSLGRRAAAASSAARGCSCVWQSPHNRGSADPSTGKGVPRPNAWRRSRLPSRPAIGIGLDESLFDGTRCHAERLLAIGEFWRDFHDRARFAHRVEVSARRLAGTGAVAIPFVVDQPRRRHQIEHRGNDAVIKPRRRNPTIFREAVIILRPQPRDDEGIGSWPALHIRRRRAGVPLSSLGTKRRRPGQRQNVKIQPPWRILP